MKNIVQRTWTGVIYVAVIVAAIMVHPFAFMCVFALFVGLLLAEFIQLMGDKPPLWMKSLCILSGMYLFIASFLFAGGYVGHMIYMPYMTMLLILLIGGLYAKNLNPVGNWGMMFFSQGYCAGTLSMLNFLAFDGGGYNGRPILVLFVLIWLNDTGAYLIGSMFGKHRLFPRISPLKSWEGFWGGLSVALLSVFLLFPFDKFLECGLFRSDGWLYRAGFAIVTVVAGTFGDLVESQIKRTIGVKDSGRILPGHGGFLDRLDSLMLAAPAAYVYSQIFR